MHPFIIDGIVFDPRANEALKHGAVVRMEPKTMELLVLLAARAGQTVTREEIFAGAWPGVVVSDDSIARCVSQLRKLFAEDPQHPRVLQTIVKKGYRLTAPVTAVEQPKSSIPVPSTPRASFRWQALLPTIVVSLIATCAVYASGRSWSVDLALVLAAAALTYGATTYLRGALRAS